MLWLAWPPLPLFPLLFVAFVPLLLLEDRCTRGLLTFRSYVFWCYLALLLWNLLATWWVAATYFGTRDPATAVAGLLANLANPLLMCLPMAAFHLTRRRYGNALGYSSFAAYWLAFEFLHLRWELAWPWLTLGYGLAQVPQLYQWYEITGPLGGTLWILAVNVFMFRVITDRRADQLLHKMLPVLAALLLPALISLYRYNRYVPQGKPRQVVVVQPNVDPYAEKFDPATLDAQLQNLIRLAAAKTDSTTDYVVFPETAIPYGIFLDELKEDESLHRLKRFIAAYPRVHLITGIHGYARYDRPATPTARPSQNGTYYWDAFNTAIQLDTSDQIPYYHKSKLVPGVERMPYPQLLRFLEPLALDMGGISGSLGMQEHRTVFFATDSTGVAPLICYESVFSEYVNEYVRRGAHLLFVITNDGWWGNTAGYKQHFQYARLLAVSQRRDVAQAANTGWSGFINQRGDVLQRTDWWMPDVRAAVMQANDRMTFYVRYGDVVGRLAMIFMLLMVVMSLWTRIAERISKKKFPL